jgi:hypothetical protein
MVATDRLLLAHVPPAVALVSAPVVPKHTEAEPAIAAGNACTVKERVTEQPVGSVYAIVTTPGLEPEISPDENPIPAIEVLLLTHVPPAVAEDNVVLNPWQIADTPVMAAGRGWTVTDFTAMQPVLRVYVIVVTPAATPDTTPVAGATDAIAVLLLLHVPPDTALANVEVAPTHTAEAPEMAEGVLLTVTTLVAMQPVGNV